MPDDAIRAEGGVTAEAAGAALSQAGIAVTELYVHERDIEELFVELMGVDPSIPAPDAAAWSQAAGAEPPRGYDGRGGGRDA